jgi:serine protease
LFINGLTMAATHKSLFQLITLLALLMWAAVSSTSLLAQPSAATPQGKPGKDYLEGRVIFKMKSAADPMAKSLNPAMAGFTAALQQINPQQVSRMFPEQQPPQKSLRSDGMAYVDLSRIFYMELPEGIGVDEAIELLISTGQVEYANHWVLPQTFFQPDDPFTGSQYYLGKTKAFDAWGVCRGDSTVVIAIIDTGIDLNHPDLKTNIAYNYNDPINGADSDNDGYIDNFHGWDLADGDNMPQYDANAHGVHVAGIAAAGTHNGTGMAGVGFNSRLLPVKISDADGRLVKSYEGIVYAADQGAKVINCSWGGAMSAGQFGQDIINYAVINRDAVVIAAAGNSNNLVRIFPASYNNVLSVAATDINDNKWINSTYNKQVDLSAPGANIFSTWPNGSYVASSGTSMAAPVVSGAAALLRSHFPGYSALQIAAQLKVTTDNIDTIPANLDYAGLMGTGRVNIYRALTETHHPFLQFVRMQHPREYYQLFNPGETFELGVEFKNLLATAENLSARLSVQSGFIEIISDVSFLGQVEHLALANNFSTPFVIKIKENIPSSREEIFTISFFNKDGVYAGQQNFSMTFNLDYVNISQGYIKTTINSKGNIGYNYPNYNQGQGLLFNNINQNISMITCAGFMAATSTSKVADNIYGAMENSFSNAFFSLENARVVANPAKGDILVKGSFNDSLAGSFRMGIKVDYRIYGFNTTPLEKILIIEYDVINHSGASMPGFYAGFFADWVIQDVRNHRAAFDAENRMGYSFSANGGSFAGVQLLSHSSIRHYAFDNQGFGGSLKITDGFTSFEKYTAMRSTRDNAGFFDKDNDISTLVSAGPFNFAAQDTIKIAFALVAGDHLNDLKANAQLASLIYSGKFSSSDDLNNNKLLKLIAHPNPSSGFLNIRFDAGHANGAEIIIYDMQAKEIYRHRLSGGPMVKHTIDITQWKNGMYIVQVKTAETVESLRVIKQ